MGMNGQGYGGNPGAGSKARIQCVGIGGAGSNSVHRISEQQIDGLECIAVNTDCMHLAFVDANAKLLIGRSITRGFGARGCVDTGQACAQEAETVLCEYIGRNVDVVFLSVGLGGGTGTGAAPIVAKVAKGNGAKVLAIATLPFSVESARRERAKEGLMKLNREADTVVVLDNDHLLEVAGDLPIDAAFSLVDNLIASVVRNIAEATMDRGLVPIDLDHVRSMIAAGGYGALAYGEGHKKAPVSAVKAAITSTLANGGWDEAQRAIVHVSGGWDMTHEEVMAVKDYLRATLKSSPRVVVGANVDPSLGNSIRVTSILMGVESSVHTPPIPGPSVGGPALEPEITFRGA
ncbi:MAG: cell division protein FtsZ [Thermoplasmata archaeon]|nr:cell division protein FtsZ [Thermoplasmata archaeon]NIS12018.1 cell division protein FtsZ [Thermoplasmata archaeon]NIS19943.1 cell division protein FtsZ [Thermoplasmata archaeon]NIT77133.1 cell division protein FtsZ [Thermoplasmata archaeon]NIU49053.1 cell division protein FtsZ [Thermoplasmata archaeon]